MSSPVLTVILVLTAFWLTATTHELGHALAGRAQRFVFKFIIVGPLQVERAATGRFSVHLNRSLLLWGGRVRSFPSDWENLTRRYAIFVAGGPAARASIMLNT